MCNRNDMNLVCYIDEAGDEGFGKLRLPGAGGQSKWLFIGALIVKASNDRLMPAWRDELSFRLFPDKPRRELHFRNLDHHHRVAACTYISGKPLGICVVGSNKQTIIGSGKEHIFKKKGYLYNYLVRYVLERVTTACKRKYEEASLSIVFSRRGGTNYQSMREYLFLMRDGKEVVKPSRSIDWTVLHPDDIMVENHSKHAGLQIADIVTSATAAAFEPNRYGQMEPRYALELCSRYIMHAERVVGCGLTLVPPPSRGPLTEPQVQFLSDFEKKRRRVPGS